MRNVLKTLALAVAGALSLSTAALAQEVRVAYGDLDLSRPADAAVFDGRVRGAVKDYCRTDGHRFGKLMPQIECRRQVSAAIKGSIPAVQRDALQIARARPLPVDVASR